jgi:Na+/H+ antiporter NhaD/arsenite permease-like protein
LPAHENHLGTILPLWSTLPFGGILLSIALGPLLLPRIWHRHYAKISFGWALLFAIPFLGAYGTDAAYELLHVLVADYVPFIVLLWGLFTAAGGIALRGTPAGTPAINTLSLLIGTAIASWVGTTGAAMLMIRPLLRANAGRRHRTHVVVFFIFLVANVGGLLTPLGDPPLFLGFLHGVPFFWTLHLLPHLLLTAGLLLGLFFAIDSRLARLEPPRPPRSTDPLRLEGTLNLLWLAGILGAVLLSGLWKPGEVAIGGLHLGIQSLVRDAIIVAMALASLRFTRPETRQANDFSWGPIREVALLFIGIFVTIVPALLILKAGAEGPLAMVVRRVTTPDRYFWATGLLSSFLDNAPTYLAFFNSQLGQFFPTLSEPEAVRELIATRGEFLAAVAAGAVLMGANTYIGNAPNFMVKSIAEEAGVAMPTFLGYIVRWALPILIPIFVLVTLVLI